MYQIQKKQNTWHRKRAIAFCLIVAAVVTAGLTFHLRSSRSDPRPKTPNQAATRPETTTLVESNDISVLLTGDWIAHDSVNAAARQTDGSYDYLPQVQALAPLFKRSDIKFCNDPILNGGQALGITGYPKFNSPTEFVSDMGKLGCNVINTASNHSFDFTQANIDASVNAWSKVPNVLAVAGENRSQVEHDTIRYFTTKGVRFAFLAYTAYSNSPPQNAYGVNVYSKELAASQIQTAKSAGAQIVIVSMRWGTEYSSTVTPAQDSAAQFLADRGADIVLGHGPHVLQPVQQLNGAAGKKTLVWYSLGNFLNTQIPAETVFNGVGMIKIDPKTLAVSPTGFVPLYMHYQWTAAQAKIEDTNARTGVKMFLLEDVTQEMIDAQQLKTTIKDQQQRLSATLNGRGLSVPLLTSKQLGL